jgi:Ni/Co efflux regulator RcnB
MKKTFLLSAAMIALLAGPALAQDRGDRNDDRGGNRGGRPAAAAPAPTPPAPAQRGAPAPRGQHAPAPQAQRGASAPQGQAAPAPNRGNFGRNDNNRPGNNGYRGNARPNYSQYNRAFSAPQRYRFRGPTYQRPYGWYSRRWSYGDFLPSLFWSSNYWINDFGYYGLMPPPPGTVWVRDGSDALLIDRYTGEIIQVEYNIFY